MGDLAKNKPLVYQNESRMIKMKEWPMATKDGQEATQDLDKLVLGIYEDAPAYAQDNEYIRKGYRIHFDSAKRILKSLFMCHNESANVWTHLSGSLLFIFLICYVAIWVSPRFVFPSYDVIKLQLNAYYTKSNNSLSLANEYFTC